MAFPETMQAIAISKTGDIDVLEKQTVPFPKQQPNHVVVKVGLIPPLDFFIELMPTSRSITEA